MLKNLQLFWGLILVLVTVALTRFVPHPPNLTAIGALALWSPIYFANKRWSFAIPAIALFLTDLVLGFYAGMVWVYGTMTLIAIASLWLEPQKNIVRSSMAAIFASLCFFFVTNFGVWTEGVLYPLTGTGLADSYIMGLPFLKYQILGDLLYCSIAFWAYRSLFVFENKAKPVEKGSSTT